jgi:hypothetical protein
LNILVLKPNATPEMTDFLLAAGQCAAAPGTKLVGRSATRDISYIATRAEAQMGARSSSRCWPNCAASSTPRSSRHSALPASSARQLFDFPIVGMTEAG